MKNKLALLCALFFCLTLQANSLEILTTIRPLYGIVKSIAGEQNNVKLLIEQNQSPHTYNFRPSDIVKAKNADIIFMIDDHFEYGLANYLNKSKNQAKAIKFTMLKDMHLIKSDLHIWLSPYNAKIMATSVAQNLSALDPDNKAIYDINLEQFIKNLDITDKYIANQLEYSKDAFITFHDAYQYFSDYFKLHNLGAVLHNHNSSPSIKQLNELKELIITKHVKCIFSEPQHSDELVNKLAKLTAIKIGKLDAEYGETLELNQDIYFNMLKNIASELQNCLETKAHSGI